MQPKMLQLWCKNLIFCTQDLCWYSEQTHCNTDSYIRYRAPRVLARLPRHLFIDLAAVDPQLHRSPIVDSYPWSLIRHRACGTKSVSELTSSYLISLSSIKGPQHLCPTELGLIARAHPPIPFERSSLSPLSMTIFSKGFFACYVSDVRKLMGFCASDR